MAHMTDEIRDALDRGPRNELEMRHLRKSIRWHSGRQTIGLPGRAYVGTRQTPPSGYNTTRGIPLERRRELDRIAEWIVQEDC